MRPAHVEAEVEPGARRRVELPGRAVNPPLRAYIPIS